jgi:hypothetical protein
MPLGLLFVGVAIVFPTWRNGGCVVVVVISGKRHESNTSGLTRISSLAATQANMRGFGTLILQIEVLWIEKIVIMPSPRHLRKQLRGRGWGRLALPHLAAKQRQLVIGRVGLPADPPADLVFQNHPRCRPVSSNTAKFDTSSSWLSANNRSQHGLHFRDGASTRVGAFHLPDLRDTSWAPLWA